MEGDSEGNGDKIPVHVMMSRREMALSVEYIADDNIFDNKSVYLLLSESQLSQLIFVLHCLSNNAPYEKTQSHYGWQWNLFNIQTHAFTITAQMLLAVRITYE
jgi:hypothetical protein